jgi:hypothetical protein
LLRIDDIVSGAKKASTLHEKSDASGKGGKKEEEESMPKEE